MLRKFIYVCMYAYTNAMALVYDLSKLFTFPGSNLNILEEEAKKKRDE